jgi:hypothetical protein
MMSRGIVFILLLPIFGCLTDLDTDKIGGNSLKPSIALPLINTSFGMKEFLERDSSEIVMQTDAEGVLFFEFEADNLLSIDFSEYFVIDDKTTREYITFSQAELDKLPIDLQVTKTVPYTIDFQSEEGDLIDSVFLINGKMGVSASSSFPTSGNMTFRFPSLSSNGEIVELVSESLDFSEEVDLQNLKVDLTQGGTTSNQFAFEVEVTLIYDASSPTPISPINSVVLEIELLDFEVSSIFGDLSERDLDAVSDSIEFQSFDNLENAAVRLEDPQILIGIGNSFGIPAELTLTKFETVDVDDNTSLTGSFDRTNLIEAPDYSSIGDTVYTNFQINKSNSNIVDFLHDLPKKINFEFEGKLNPDGASQDNFALSTSTIDLGFKVIIPLVGQVFGLEAEDYYDFDGISDLNGLEVAQLKISSTNGLPFTLDLGITFLDENGAEIYELLTTENQRILEGGKVNEFGDVVEPSFTENWITASDEDLDILKQATQIRVSSRVATSNDGNSVVKVTDFQQVTIKIGMYAQVSVEL